MIRQKHSNPLKDPEFPARFARLLAKYIIKSRISDEQLAYKMNEVAGPGSGSLATIRRHKGGTGGVPTYRMIGIYKEALEIPENEVDLLIDPDRAASPAGAPSFLDLNEQWRQLLEYFQRQSQLPHHIQNERARANEAFKEGNYDEARKHLENVSEWTRSSYRDHRMSLAYAAEEYGRALASLGALAFTSMDFAEARVQFLRALGLAGLPSETRDRYRRSYLISSTALAAESKSEMQARAILKEMADNDVPPNVVSYNSLMNFVKSEAEARAILKEMTDNGVTPNVVSYNSLMNFVKSEAEARAILKEMTDNGVTPDVVSYSTLLNFVKSEAEARAIIKEMADNGVTPNVVSYSTLLNFVKSEAEARAILKEMADNGVTPNEITVISAVKKTKTFEDALGLIDFCCDKNFFVGRGAFQAAFSKSITHLTAEQLLAEYHARKYKFDTALESPINQYRRAGRADLALMLTLVAPQVGSAQRLYRDNYTLCRAFFQTQLAAGNEGDNVYYALGIAAALNGDWEIAKPNLKTALERSYASKRVDYIKTLLSESPP
jgi:plasmid stability protein